MFDNREVLLSRNTNNIELSKIKDDRDDRTDKENANNNENKKDEIIIRNL